MKQIIFVIFLGLLALQTQCQADEQIIFEEEPQDIIPEPVQPPKQEITRSFPKFEFNKETLILYRYEVAAIFAIMAYLIMYKRGKYVNAEIIEKFYNKTKNYINDNFQHIGYTKQSGENPFVGQSPNDAMFYASGRDNCDYLQITFTMRKRQDLIYYLFYEAIYPEKDLITIDIPVHADHPIVFCLANKKKVKNLVDKYLDISKLTGAFEVSGLHDNFTALGQSADMVNTLVDNHVVRKVQDLSTLIVSLHYTDQKMFSESSGHLRAVFYASAKNQQKYLSGLELLFYLVDKINKMKVSSTYKTKALKSRQIFHASKQRQNQQKYKQEMRKKKQQKKRQEQAWLRSLPPQKQKRQDEKRKKKQLNKMLKSKTMKVM